MKNLTISPKMTIIFIVFGNFLEEIMNKISEAVKKDDEEQAWNDLFAK